MDEVAQKKFMQLLENLKINKANEMMRHQKLDGLDEFLHQKRKEFRRGSVKYKLTGDELLSGLGNSDPKIQLEEFKKLKECMSANIEQEATTAQQVTQKS